MAWKKLGDSMMAYCAPGSKTFPRPGGQASDLKSLYQYFVVFHKTSMRRNQRRVKGFRSP